MNEFNLNKYWINYEEFILILENYLQKWHKRVIFEYYGINWPCKTLKEIWNTYWVTVERVRQVKERWLKRIKDLLIDDRKMEMLRRLIFDMKIKPTESIIWNMEKLLS
jgi:DNA-directed RNA polymerase sigma subunit (sigma70/sigma32)